VRGHSGSAWVARVFSFAGCDAEGTALAFSSSLLAPMVQLALCCGLVFGDLAPASMQTSNYIKAQSACTRTECHPPLVLPRACAGHQGRPSRRCAVGVTDVTLLGAWRRGTAAGGSVCMSGRHGTATGSCARWVGHRHRLTSAGPAGLCTDYPLSGLASISKQKVLRAGHLGLFRLWWTSLQEMAAVGKHACILSRL
jgi:hypothetical protein